MGAKNITGVRKVIRGGKPHLVIDFRYTDTNGVRQRFRRDAAVQLQGAAYAEAKRLMARAAETGSPEEEESTVASQEVVLFRSFVETTFETHFFPKYRPSTRRRYRELLQQGVLAYFGDKPLAGIGAMDLRGYAAQLEARHVQLKGPTSFVRTILRSAVEAKVIDEMPMLPRLFKESRKLPDTYGDEEIASLLGGTKGWLRLAIALGALAGLRMGEVFALEVRDIDFIAGRIYVRRALSDGQVLTPKSGHDRLVPLLPELGEMLREAARDRPQTERLVLDDEHETPPRQNVLHELLRAIRRLGLRTRTFHSLRHYFCSTLIRRGASVEAVRLLAGHTKLATTERYVHATAADLESAVAKLGSRAPAVH